MDQAGCPYQKFHERGVVERGIGVSHLNNARPRRDDDGVGPGHQLEPERLAGDRVARAAKRTRPLSASWATYFCPGCRSRYGSITSFTLPPAPRLERPRCGRSCLPRRRPPSLSATASLPATFTCMHLLPAIRQALECLSANTGVAELLGLWRSKRGKLNNTLGRPRSTRAARLVRQGLCSPCSGRSHTCRDAGGCDTGRI